MSVSKYGKGLDSWLSYQGSSSSHQTERSDCSGVRRHHMNSGCKLPEHHLKLLTNVNNFSVRALVLSKTGRNEKFLERQSLRVFVLLYQCSSNPKPGWRNWQTQRTQNPPGFGSWGFRLPLPAPSERPYITPVYRPICRPAQFVSSTICVRTWGQCPFSANKGSPVR